MYYKRLCIIKNMMKRQNVENISLFYNRNYHLPLDTNLIRWADALNPAKHMLCSWYLNMT